MRTGTRWGWGATGVLLCLFVAYLVQERRRPGSEMAIEFESRGEEVAAAGGARQLLPGVGLGAQRNWQVSTSRSSALQRMLPSTSQGSASLHTSRRWLWLQLMRAIAVATTAINSKVLNITTILPANSSS